jgi:MSHA biogenesis protein MshN
LDRQVNLSSQKPPVSQTFKVKASDGAKSTLSHLRAQAHLASKRGDDVGVIENLQAIIRLTPEDLRTRKQLAALLFSKNKLQSAKKELLKAIVQAPADSSIRLMLARVHFKSGDDQLALSVLVAHPSNSLANDELLSFRAALAEKVGEYAVSQQDYQLLVQRNPSEAKWWLGLGVSQDKQMLINQALTSYEQAQSLKQLPQQVDSFVQQRIALLTERS